MNFFKKLTNAADSLKDTVEETAVGVKDKIESASKACGETLDELPRVEEAMVEISSLSNETADRAKKTFTSVKDKVESQFGAALAFLATPELLGYFGKLTDGPATIYDKAMDMEYLKTAIGGGNHRMFDGGHTITGAWEKVREAVEDDTFVEEVIGYSSGIWKDITTSKGLPFFTIEKATYDEWVLKVSEMLPFVSKEYLYDLLSFDALEIISCGLGGAAVLFGLNEDDQGKLAEILGKMGVLSISSANPIMGLMVIGITAYSYALKKKEFDGKSAGKGAALAGIGVAMFSVMGFHVLIEFIIVIAVSVLFRKHILDNEKLGKLIALGLDPKNVEENVVAIVDRIKNEV